MARLVVPTQVSDQDGQRSSVLLEKEEKEIDDALSLSEEERSLSSGIFNILGTSVKGESLQMLHTSGFSGFEAWRKKNIRVMHAHDGTGELVKSSASTHTVKEFVPAEHRDIASSNANNKFNFATDEENIDFNIPGVPNSTVKRSHGVNVHNLIQKIENHPQRQALQSYLQQH